MFFLKGSVLSPFLFIMYTADTTETKFSKLIYASNLGQADYLTSMEAILMNDLIRLNRYNLAPNSKPYNNSVAITSKTIK